jgi:hypothetical protein
METTVPVFVFLTDRDRSALSGPLQRCFPSCLCVLVAPQANASPLAFQRRIAGATAIIAPEEETEAVRALAAEVAPVVGWRAPEVPGA